MTRASEFATPAQADMELRSPIIDLRQYTLYPGTRDEFVALFDRELVETQEAAGMGVIGQFRDMGDHDRFVWICRRQAGDGDPVSPRRATPWLVVRLSLGR